MRIYTEEGYPDIESWMSEGIPFIFAVGGRGTGKTYSALLYAFQKRRRFMFLRNSQTQVRRLMKPQYNVFKKINSDRGEDIQVQKDADTGIFYDKKREEEIGYLSALSTFSNFRGPDMSDVDLIIWDEFIPETQERLVKDSGTVFFNTYETIARNRELEGEPALPVLFLANSNRLDNPIFVELGLVREAEKMTKKGIQFKINRERGYMIIFLNESPISKKKQDTALYKLVGERSAFFQMSIANSFNLEDTDLIRSLPLREFTPLLNVGELTIYQHKSNGTFYASGHMIQAPEKYLSTKADLERFRQRYLWLYRRYLQQLVSFEDYMSLALFCIYLKGKR